MRKEIRPRLSVEDSLEKEIKDLAQDHRRTFNDEIVIALEEYARKWRRNTPQKEEREE